MLPGRAAVLPGGAAAPHVSFAGECAACSRGVSYHGARCAAADRAGGPGRFFKIYIFDDCQIIENNNRILSLFSATRLFRILILNSKSTSKNRILNLD